MYIIAIPPCIVVAPPLYSSIQLSRIAIQPYLVFWLLLWSLALLHGIWRRQGSYWLVGCDGTYGVAWPDRSPVSTVGQLGVYRTPDRGALLGQSTIGVRGTIRSK